MVFLPKIAGMVGLLIGICNMIFTIAWYWVLLAALVYFGIGAVWYSPALFAKQWAKALGRQAGDMGTDPTQAMIVTALTMLVLVMVEAYFVHATGTMGMWRGAYLGAKLWLGFVATTAFVNNSFQSGSKKLYLIDQGYHLVGIVVAGAILAH
jgi:hypothetical protein